ncbi:MAG: hypothetical protein HPY52_12485 [Firmicutes bacterium]|nr:hypothetical protein [Bacillota bacterium]
MHFFGIEADEIEDIPDGMYAWELGEEGWSIWEGIGGSYNAVMAWLKPNGYRMAGPVRENYLCSPGDTNDPARYVTGIQVPVGEA